MLKRILNKLLSPLTLLRDALLERSLGDLSERERFERIYKSGYWRPIIGGSLLGAGSNLNSTEEICEELLRFLDNYQIKSILDLPCDDWFETPKWKEIEEQFKEVDVKVVYFPYTKSTSSTLLNSTLGKLRNE